MRVTILQSNFAKALSQVSRIVGSRTTLPVLSNVLIVAKKGKIKISATDLEVGISTQTIGKIDEEGEVTLPARLLSDFVLNNKDESIDISAENLKVTLKSSRFEANLTGIAAEEFPVVPEPPEGYLVEFEKAAFMDALKKVSIAPANDETRPVLAGIYFLFDGHDLLLAATDSFRLAEKKMTLPSEHAERKVVIPSRTVNELLRLLGSTESETISLAAAENQIAFVVGETYIVSRLIEGVFPNYSQIIPTSFKVQAKVKLSDLVSAVKMSSLFARDLANNNIKLGVDKGGLTVSSATSQMGSAKSKVAAETTGEGLEIAFNARYILDVLNVLGQDEVILKFNDGSSAAVVGVEKDPGFTYIIMPLKVEN